MCHTVLKTAYRKQNFMSNKKVCSADQHSPLGQVTALTGGNAIPTISPQIRWSTYPSNKGLCPFMTMTGGLSYSYDFRAVKLVEINKPLIKKVGRYSYS